jgi:hypothetical protein
MAALKRRAYALEPIPGYPLNYYDQVLDDFLRQRIQQATSHGFQKGERMNQAINHVIETRSEQAKLNCQRETQDMVKEQQMRLAQDLADFDRETERLRREILADTEREREKLEASQAYARDLLAERWNSDPKRRQYNRASVNLITQRRMRAVLLQQNRFTDAEQVNGIVENLEDRETRESHELIGRDYAASAGRLAAKHEGELEHLEIKSVVAQAQLNRRRQMERMILVHRELKLTTREEEAKDKDKLWVMRSGRGKRGPQPRGGGSKLSLTATMPKAVDLTTIRLPPLQKIPSQRRTFRPQSPS